MPSARIPQTSLIAAILTLTSFEVHRAGVNCRVDMVNTALMVGAMYLLYRWWEKGKNQLPWLAILCMSGATLTKGPVGIILPCFVMGVFMLTQRENFWGIVWRMALTAVLSLIIPFCWYYAAYLQGGDEFLRLVKEENIDRFMGKMASNCTRTRRGTTCSHSLRVGLPYTLLLLFSLFILPWKKFSEDQVPGECEEGHSAAGIHLARLPPGALLLLHPEEQAQRLSAAMLSVHGLSHR